MTSDRAKLIKKCHWIKYGKLIDEASLHGAIAPGAEHRVVAHSAGFPDELRLVASLDFYLPQVTSLEDALVEEVERDGAFFYHTALVNDESFSVAARIVALPEKGEGQPGRRYVEITAIVFPTNEWSSGLILAAYHELFLHRSNRRFSVARSDCPKIDLHVAPKGEDTLRVRSETVVLPAPKAGAIIRSESLETAVLAYVGLMDGQKHIDPSILAGLSFAFGVSETAQGGEFDFAIRWRCVTREEAFAFKDSQFVELPLARSKPPINSLVCYLHDPWRLFWYESGRGVVEKSVAESQHVKATTVDGLKVSYEVHELRFYEHECVRAVLLGPGIFQKPVLAEAEESEALASFEDFAMVEEAFFYGHETSAFDAERTSAQLEKKHKEHLSIFRRHASLMLKREFPREVHAPAKLTETSAF